MGHSILSIEEFIERVRKWGIQQVIDVRTIPKSRHNPQFEKEALIGELKKSDIFYLHLKALGGLRKPVKDSENDGWRNSSFRGYADYMQTPKFEEALVKLISLAREKTSVILCAEAVPWRCHRSLVADALVSRGFHVEDIFSERLTRPHLLNPMARVRGNNITYPLAKNA